MYWMNIERITKTRNLFSEYTRITRTGNIFSEYSKDHQISVYQYHKISRKMYIKYLPRQVVMCFNCFMMCFICKKEIIQSNCSYFVSARQGLPDFD